MYDNPFLFSIMTILYASIAMFGISLFCKFFGGSESSEDEQLTPEKARQYLLDKYKAEIIWSDLLLSIRGLRLIIELIKNTYGVDAITQ